ncbi:MAG TPA: IgGFc-binding protein, partial [Candidatus Kapabacteria bacterium]
MKHRVIFAVMSAFFILFASHVYAQGISTDGKDFYVGFVNPSFNRVVQANSANFFRVYLIVGSYQDNTVSISYFTDEGTEDTVVKYKVQKRKSIQIQLDLTRIRMTDPGDLIKEYRSVHVTAESPISVQFFSSGADGCGMYTSIPTTLLGRKYVAASYNDNPEGTLALIGGGGPSVVDVACGFFEIIGTKNGTTVTITPTTTTQGGKHVGVNKGPGSTGIAQPYSISLNRGQCYMVKSGCIDNQFDFTGSIIESDKPVAVISGHENAGLGSVGNRSLEGRDYMVEQMIPVNHWDNKDYVSIPLVDSEPYNADHTGEHYRAIVYDTSTVNISMSVAGTSGTTIFPLSRYKTAQAPEIESPISFTSNTKPFLVYQIDQTNQSAKQPFARPAMSEIIPVSRWKNSYLWLVPSNVDERLQAYYVNIIAPKAKFDSIYISKGGQKDVMIGQAGLSVVKVWQNIPNHPELIGKTYKVVPGSYYARANFPFVVYHYGNRAIDADGDLGDFDGDDYFFSYATALGYQYTSPDSGNISITVDTLCNSWKVCVTDNTAGGGVSSITLLDDPNGDFIIPPSGHAPYQYSNVVFDPKDDPSGMREIIFSGDNKSECVTINIQNPGKDGYAPLMIAAKGGETRVIELSLSKSPLAITPNPATGGNLGLRKVGSGLDSVCTFINLPSSKRDYLVTNVSLIGKDTAIKILSVMPTLPALIKPGDTLKYVVRFTAVDTAKHYDTVLIATDCSNIRIPLMAEGGCGIISTSDLDFGYLIVGSSFCVDTLQIRNTGKLSFTLTSDFLLQDTTNFSIDPIGVTSSANRFYTLPHVIEPGDYVRVRLCYDPKGEGTDSTALIWKTDIPSPYTL